jgi:hypothetical protein
MHKLSTYLVMTLFLHNGLPRWNQILTQCWDSSTAEYLWASSGWCTGESWFILAMLAASKCQWLFFVASIIFETIIKSPKSKKWFKKIFNRQNCLWYERVTWDFLLLYFKYFEIWLHILMDFQHLSNITKLEFFFAFVQVLLN